MFVILMDAELNSLFKQISDDTRGSNMDIIEIETNLTDQIGNLGYRSTL